ncbi:unnamed protein product [Cunninghamella echinulata]
MIFYSIVIITSVVVIYNCINTIRIEIDHHVKQSMEDMEISIRKCYQKYQENQCYQESLSPILKTYCDEWLKCVNRNPKLIKKVNIAARIFGEMINHFCQTLSTKTMIASCILVFAAILFSFSF